MEHARIFGAVLNKHQHATLRSLRADVTRAQECIDRIDAALRGDARSAMLVVAAQEIINDYREGQEIHE